MKKIAFLLMFVFLFSSPFYVSANDVFEYSSSAEEVVYFSDGSYMVTYIELDDDGLDSSNQARATGNYEVGGTKAVEYYDTADNLDWKVKVAGVFLIVPSNSLQSGMCQSSDLTYNIYDSSWHIYNIVEQVITNNACGRCTMKSKFLGITTQTVNVEINLTCDYEGNLS